MPTEADAAPTCDECGGTPDACICDAYDALMDRVPDPPETPKGADWSGWLRRAVRESNDGVEVGAGE